MKDYWTRINDTDQSMLIIIGTCIAIYSVFYIAIVFIGEIKKIKNGKRS